MHLAVDAHNLATDRRGIGVYVRAVLARLLAQPDLNVTLLVKHPLPVLERARLVRELGGLGNFRVAGKVPSGADVLWSPWNGTFFAPRSARAVATVHDLAPFVFPASERRCRRSQQEPFYATARTARRVLTDSQFIRGELEQHLGIESARVTVVPLAADERFSPGVPQQLPPALRGCRYVLYVGMLEARKNFATLASAWRMAFPAREVQLAAVSADTLPSDVVALRRPSLEELRDLYRGALALAFPSLYEGFGLPPLEAMACGTPAVVSRAAAIPEVCGDAAAYVEDPLDAQAWAHSLQLLAADGALRGRLRERGLRQAASFSWERTAQATLAALLGD